MADFVRVCSDVLLGRYLTVTFIDGGSPWLTEAQRTKPIARRWTSGGAAEGNHVEHLVARCAENISFLHSNRDIYVAVFV